MEVALLGVWGTERFNNRFKLNLEATEPEEDDVIQIFSPINKTSSVSFRLANRLKAYSPFTAFFSADSDPEFTEYQTSNQNNPSA